MLKIRFHHLQCIRYFVGHGYSPEFTVNMTEIVSRLKKGEPFVLTDDNDDVCKACPFLVNGVCESIRKVTRFDRDVSEALMVKTGEEYRYSDIEEKMAGQCLLSCCRGCNWKRLCRKIEKERNGR